MACAQCYLAGPQQARDTLNLLEARIADMQPQLERVVREHDRMHAILLDLQRLANDRADAELIQCLAGV